MPPAGKRLAFLSPPYSLDSPAGPQLLGGILANNREKGPFFAPISAGQADFAISPAREWR